jgi:elongation factor P hydroxylase
MKLAEHDCQQLVMLFNDLFRSDYQTCLVGGVLEPLYKPRTGQDDYHQLFFREDFYASALHETAHWCIAGPKRRQQTDFGYWYTPDGRDVLQQARFETVEIKPQALEWIFSVAAGYTFKLSADNLSGEATDGRAFAKNVSRQAHAYCRNGLPTRAGRFVKALNEYYGTTSIFQHPFDIDKLC